jgi:Icc-related predicted phosphoesterase
MTQCLFVSDLHGNLDRYQKFFKAISEYLPDLVFIGGDILPSGLMALTQSGLPDGGFLDSFLIPQFSELKTQMGEKYPLVFLVLGNDDGRFEEDVIISNDKAGLWHYMHDRKYQYGRFSIYGYAYVPPSPFMLKDWEKYDVSRYVDPGCVSPEEGFRSVKISEHDMRYATIADDLNSLIGNDDLSDAIFLFHTPPHNTNLDHIFTGGKMIDFVPIDPHVGSIAVRRMIEEKQPLITLHGHVHESAVVTGDWRDKIGRTCMFSAAHDGPELSLIRFDAENPDSATRILI